jgi:Flp pilus assembly pilin Flp
MNTLCTNLYLSVRNLIEREEGPDLVEYALVVALIAFGAIAGMNVLASGLNNAFSQIATTLNSNV